MRILVIEDEADLRRVIGQALREEGYAVDEAADGEAGLHKTEVWDYDVVVLDLMLPRVDGWEVLTRLRRKSQRAAVLLLTARDEVGDRVRGLDAGADDYLVKPFALTELIARIRALIRRATGNAVSTIAIGDVIVETAARRVKRGDEAIVLTAREYALVEFLVLHRGRLVTRTMLYDHLFDENESSFSNLVDVHVHNVRKKLGKDFIQTRRGHGYIVGE